MRLFCALLVALSVSLAHAASPSSSPRLGLILSKRTLVRSAPTPSAQVLTTLVQQTQVKVLDYWNQWAHVEIWAGVRGWMPRGEIAFRKPWPTVSTYVAPVIPSHPLAHGVVPVSARATLIATTTRFDRPHGQSLGSLAGGTTVTVSAWQQDSKGELWYEVGKSWLPGAGVQFDRLQHGTASAPIRFIAGKGMWLTLGTTGASAPGAIVQAAIHNGITHLYVESAISPLGFDGRDSVAQLLPEAHRHHLAVIAWVFPYLTDIAQDVALTREVAAFRAPSGDRFDGIAADLERNVTVETVRGYTQLVRTYLGPSYLLVGVTYPPQSNTGVPFGEVARNCDAIAPMDYWHQTKSDFGLDYGRMRYSYAYAYRYAVDSIRTIRRAAGTIPIAPIGQTFDDFGRYEIGPYAPSPAEIKGFLAGSKAGGAWGVSFFQWMTAAYEEWQTIHDYRF